MPPTIDRTQGEEARQGAVDRFLAAVGADATLPPYVKPVDAAVATVCALFERLTAGQAHDLLLALPTDLRPLFERCYARRVGRPVVHIGRAELVDRVSWDLGVAPASAELIAAAVFHALEATLPPEQIAHVTRQLPRDLQELWLVVPAVGEDVAGDLDLQRQLLDDIERSGTLLPRMSARDAFSTVMCLFAQRLSGGEARELWLGFPRSVRPFVDRCLLERHEHGMMFGVNELTANVAQALGTELEEADAIIDAVLAAATRILPREVLDHVASQLPEDLRTLWSA